MVSAISVCLLALGLTAVSSQLLSNDEESPVAERRTFKHGKPVKILPLVKKHKKFGAFVPHVFGKTHYEVPVVHEGPKPYYKAPAYHGVEVRPTSDFSFSTAEPFVETHSIEPPTDFGPSFSSDHSFSAPSGGYVYDKPSFPFPPEPVFAPLPPSPPKQVFSFVPAPQPVFQSIPIASPAFTIARPAPIQSLPPPAPVFTQIPASLPPPQPVFSVIPVKIQAPVLPSLPAPSPAPAFPSLPAPSPAPVFPSLPAPSPAPVFPSLPAPSPAPVFSSVPIKVHHPAPAFPSLPAPTPAPALPALPSPSPSPIIVKIPAPVLPSVPASLPAPSPAPILPSLPVVSATPAPILPSLPVVSATPAPAFSSIPVSLPPPQFSVPAPAPSLPTFPVLPNFSVASTPEPEFPYPPSGTPIPSYIKDISLGDIEIKGSAVSTVEPPKFEQVTPVIEDGSKNLEHVLGAINTEPGFFQKFKGWKADKANAALSHFTQFKQKPAIQAVAQPNKIPVEIPAQPSFQLPPPANPLPLAPASIFPIFPPAQFFSPAKYESFPPNNIESPPLLNSYGVPIPHDSYAPPHISHERLSSAASEEEPAVVAAPEKKEQIPPAHQKFQPQAIPHEHPVYVAEDNKTDNKTIEDVQQETESKEQNADEVVSNYPNHKE